MSTDSHPSLEARAITALFAVAARDGWRQATLATIAADAGLEPEELSARFASREAILARFVVETDREVVEGTLPRAEGETLRDRLFDVVMRRIDAAQRHRAGLIAVRRALRTDPFAALGLAPFAATGARLMLDAAGIRTDGLLGLARINAFMVLLVPVARAWEQDESPDLGKTMAALDTALTRAEQAESWVGRLPLPGRAEG